MLAAQLAGLAAVAPGAAADVDAACRDVFADAGYGDWFIHGTGHGVGLDIHEDPFASTVSTDELLVEGRGDRRAGLYRDGFGGVRIEDLVAVTADGGRRSPTCPRTRHACHHHQRPEDRDHAQLDNGLFQVVEFQHVKPGKGGAFVRTKLRNVSTGNVLERTFNAGIRVEQAIVDRQDMQFLYRDGDDYVFMNTSTYDQITVPPAALGDAADYLVEQAIAQIAQYQGADHRRRDPGVGRADGHPDRAGRAGRPRLGCPQAGRAGDRQDGAGAAVRRDGDRVRVDTRSRRLHHPCETGTTTRPTAAPTPRSGRCTCSTRRRPRTSRRSTPRAADRRARRDDRAPGPRRRRAPGRLDAAIAARATGWSLERMPVLDLNVLRLGAFELAERPDVPVAVVIDEAVELAKRFSTDNSGRFVNGVLSAAGRRPAPVGPDTPDVPSIWSRSPSGRTCDRLRTQPRGFTGWAAAPPAGRRRCAVAVGTTSNSPLTSRSSSRAPPRPPSGPGWCGR